MPLVQLVTHLYTGRHAYRHRIFPLKIPICIATFSCKNLPLDRDIHTPYNICMATQTLNIALPEELVKKIDAQAKKEYRNRSELIREAVRVYIDDKSEWEAIFRAGEKAMQEMGIKSEQEVDDIVYEYRHGRKPR